MKKKHLAENAVSVLINESFLLFIQRISTQTGK